MDAQALATATQRQPSPETSDPKHRISGKVRLAIDAMVLRGRNRAQAAQDAGLQEDSLYRAFMKPEVKGYYLQQLEVLRSSERARNIHALVEVRDQLDNQMARVNAVKALEQLADQPQARTGSQQSAGLVIVINNGALTTQQRDAAANPLIEHEPVISAQSNRDPSQP